MFVFFLRRIDMEFYRNSVMETVSILHVTERDVQGYVPCSLQVLVIK